MKTSAIQTIHALGRLVFTTREIAGLTGTSLGSATQNLSRLAGRGIIKKIMQGVWGLTSDKRFSPFQVIPFLAPQGRTYLSFISALHFHGVISQIPQVMTVAGTVHSKKVKTSVGVFDVHQISGDLFDGFDWHEGGDYLIATPEKAFVDCLYLASRKGKRFAHFPELDAELLDKKKINKWLERIKDARIRKAVEGYVKDRFYM